MIDPAVDQAQREAGLAIDRKRGPNGRYLSHDGLSHPRRQRIGIYSEIGALASLDGRSWQYKYFRAKCTELEAHLSGNLTYIQRQLVERCAWLQLKLTMLDLKLAKDDGRHFTQQDNNVYLAWTNSLARTLSLLGVTVGKGIKKPRALRGHKLITPGDGETVADLVGDKP
jgi:hypothetical protein